MSKRVKKPFSRSNLPDKVSSVPCVESLGGKLLGLCPVYTGQIFGAFLKQVFVSHTNASIRNSCLQKKKSCEAFAAGKPAVLGKKRLTVHTGDICYCPTLLSQKPTGVPRHAVAALYDTQS